MVRVTIKVPEPGSSYGEIDAVMLVNPAHVQTVKPLEYVGEGYVRIKMQDGTEIVGRADMRDFERGRS